MQIDLEKINKLPPDVRKKWKINAIKSMRKKKESQIKSDFLNFVKHIWPEFIEGYHHRIIAKKFNDLASGKINRLIVNMPPRHTKSEFASFLLPAWMMGNKPKLKIIQATHTAELAVRFGRKTKNLIDSEEYKDLFDISLQQDSKAAGRWETNQGGEYFAVGVEGAVTGRGADLLIIDDPHSEQDAQSKEGRAYDKAYEWYQVGPRQRLQPKAKIVLVMTRWSKKDLTAQLLKAQMESTKGDRWEVVEFPAIMPSGKPVWPEFWDLEELEKQKASISASKWSAQWMQNPVAEEGAIIKREWWQPYEEKISPKFYFIIQSYDTAYSKRETADYSAITTWGIFYPDENPKNPHIMLIAAERGRWDFPELKSVAHDLYEKWRPNICIIEAKATGQPLIDELRTANIPVQAFIPGKNTDKHSRVHICSSIFHDKKVHYPLNEEFASDVIEECASFPFGSNDDYVDSTTQALMRFRQGGFIKLEMDFEEEQKPTKKYEYY